MKSLKTLIFAGLFVMITSVAKSNIHNTVNNPGFAVIELFTSEGCSSCPPADAVVAKIEKESSGKPIYILAFHVDYWDRGGWKDIFSSADYTARQHKYARWLSLSQIYTPQAIVNGKAEFVGSEEGKLRTAIKNSLGTNAVAQLNLSNVKIEQGKVNVQYEAKGNSDNSTLVLAVVQKSARDNVKAGENSGRTLSHVQIVRAFKGFSVKHSGSVSVDLPKGFDAHGNELIAFLQNNSTGLITGATKASL